MECLLAPVAVSSSFSLRDPSRDLTQSRQGLKGELRPSAFITRRSFSGSVSTSYRRLRPCSAAPDEEKMTRRSPLDFPIEWERPGPGRRPDVSPTFSPMKTPLPPPLPADPPEKEEGDEEEEEEQTDPEEEPEQPPPEE